MIVEFLKDTPIEGSRKFFQAGQRYVFERERGAAFVKAGAAREVRKLYTQAELEEKSDSMSVTEFLDMLANETQQNAGTDPVENKKERKTKTKKK